MQEAPPTESARLAAQRSVRGRRVLLLLLAVALVPFVLAVLLVTSEWRPSGDPRSYGELLEPARPLPVVALRNPDGNPASADSLRGHWTLLTVAQNACTAACRHNLWKMQQVRLAQGQHMKRVERVLLVTSRARLSVAALAQEYPGTQILIADAAALAPLVRALADSDSAGERVYLVDPNGNLVLRYAPDAEPSGLRKDLARLLRLSRIG
jgi:cytochrome oxidase Cu insertion factor (SCO1/SenC/PrrC family)